MTHLDRLRRKQQREIDEQELEGHFKGPSSLTEAPEQTSGTETSDEDVDGPESILLKPLPGTRWDRGSALATEFAIRFGIRSAGIPYQPVPPVFYDDTRARRRVQVLRSYSRMFAKDREPPAWATNPSG